jgi:hypothetical protein
MMGSGFGKPLEGACEMAITTGNEDKYREYDDAVRPTHDDRLVE